MKVTKSYSYPCVMGIINITPDSFYAASRAQEEEVVYQRVQAMLADGARMIDVGAYSTRPGAAEVTEEEELARLRWALPIVRKAVETWTGQRPEALEQEPMISVDTYRARVAEVCVCELGADIINDVSGGTLDDDMLPVVARTGAAYVLMHMRGTPQTMQQLTDYPEGVTRAVIDFFERQLARLRGLAEQMGRALGTVILDPGFGFAKTLEQNYELMRGLDAIRQALPDYPLLVGISRKSMIYKLLGTSAEEALNGTTVLNTYALQHGAAILRVHDVREAVEAVKINGKL